MDVDLDRPIEDEHMDYDEDGSHAIPEAGLTMEKMEEEMVEYHEDGDEMMDEPILVEEGHEEMEAEPTPPVLMDQMFSFAKPAVHGVPSEGVIPEIAESVGGAVEDEDVESVPGAPCHDDPLIGEGGHLEGNVWERKGGMGDDAPADNRTRDGTTGNVISSNTSINSSTEPSSSEMPPVASPAAPDPSFPPSNICYQDTPLSHPIQPSSSHAGPSKFTPRPAIPAEVDEEYPEEYDATAEEDYPLNIHSLPAIILHLPVLGARCLFTPLPADDLDAKLPVWLSGREEELGEASLTDVWVAIRAEMVREGFEQEWGDGDWGKDDGSEDGRGKSFRRTSHIFSQIARLTVYRMISTFNPLHYWSFCRSTWTVIFPSLFDCMSLSNQTGLLRGSMPFKRNCEYRRKEERVKLYYPSPTGMAGCRLRMEQMIRKEKRTEKSILRSMKEFSRTQKASLKCGQKVEVLKGSLAMRKVRLRRRGEGRDEQRRQRALPS